MNACVNVQATTLRGAIGGLHGQFGVNQPNLWSAHMKFVCDLLILMFIVGTPCQAFVYEVGAFQISVVVFTFCQVVSRSPSSFLPSLRLWRGCVLGKWSALG